MKLDDKLGIPWTAHLNLPSVVLLVLVTAGVFPVILALYLALWIGLRRKAWLPLTCFVAFTLITYLSYAAVEHAILSGIMDALVLLAPVLWILGTFLLREEILLDARAEGFEREIDLFPTFFLSSLYLNFCLHPAASLRTRKHPGISLKPTGQS